MRGGSWAGTRNTYRTWKRTVGTVNKSRTIGTATHTRQMLDRAAEIRTGVAKRREYSTIVAHY